MHSNITVQVQCYHTTCDSVLYEYYITESYKNMNYKRLIKYRTGRGSRAGKESWESDKGDRSGGLSGTISRFCQVPILGLAMFPLRTPISNRNSPSSRIWICRFMVVRIQPSEYIRKPNGVCKNKYTCTKNKWTCLCMIEIMFKSYQWKHM